MECLAINKHQSWAKVPSVIRRLRARKEMNFSTSFAFFVRCIILSWGKNFFSLWTFHHFSSLRCAFSEFFCLFFSNRSSNGKKHSHRENSQLKIMREYRMNWKKWRKKNSVIPFPLSGEGSRHEMNMKNALRWNRIHVPHFTWLIKWRALRCRRRVCRRNVSGFFAFFMNFQQIHFIHLQWVSLHSPASVNALSLMIFFSHPNRQNGNFPLQQPESSLVGHAEVTRVNVNSKFPLFTLTIRWIHKNMRLKGWVRRLRSSWTLISMPKELTFCIDVCESLLAAFLQHEKKVMDDPYRLHKGERNATFAELVELVRLFNSKWGWTWPERAEFNPWKISVHMQRKILELNRNSAILCTEKFSHFLLSPSRRSTDTFTEILTWWWGERKWEERAFCGGESTEKKCKLSFTFPHSRVPWNNEHASQSVSRDDEWKNFNDSKFSNFPLSSSASCSLCLDLPCLTCPHHVITSSLSQFCSHLNRRRHTSANFSSTEPSQNCSLACLPKVSQTFICLLPCPPTRAPSAFIVFDGSHRCVPENRQTKKHLIAAGFGSPRTRVAVYFQFDFVINPKINF